LRLQTSGWKKKPLPSTWKLVQPGFGKRPGPAGFCPVTLTSPGLRAIVRRTPDPGGCRSALRSPGRTASVTWTPSPGKRWSPLTTPARTRSTISGVKTMKTAGIRACSGTATPIGWQEVTGNEVPTPRAKVMAQYRSECGDSCSHAPIPAVRARWRTRSRSGPGGAVRRWW
jgi:hypothetical protein